MRFKLLARRITLTPTLAVALILTVAACGSSSSTPASSSSSSTPAASSPAATGSSAAAGSPGTGSSSAAVAQITANWEKFFNASTPTAEKVTLLQNGSAFASAIDTLIKGSATVLIGGLPAVRQGDITAHGGTVVAGCPTVLIG